MPFPFTLPTTSSFSYSSVYRSPSHPSLPLSAGTHRAVLRAVLKAHKRLPSPSQAGHLAAVVSAVDAYLPYLFIFVDWPAEIQREPAGPSPASIEWRPMLAEPAVPGIRERLRVKISRLEHEVSFVLATLAGAYSLMARAGLQPLYDSSATFLEGQARTTAITTATRHLLEAAAVYGYLVARAERRPPPGHQPPPPPPCPDVAPEIMRALGALALAEATLLAVLKDDPYPAVVAQDRNKQDREWMYKAPSIPKVRAHLFARLCLAAADHAATASSLCHAASDGAAGGGRISDGLVRYLEDLRRASRARACRFFGIDAEIGGDMGTALAWLKAGLHELGVEGPAARGVKSGSSGSSGGGGLGFGRLRKEWDERREDRRIEKDAMWGMDGGKMEERRVIEMLEAKWTKINDTINTQTIPPIGRLLSQMPSGREIHTVKEYLPASLDQEQLEAFRAPPDPNQSEDNERDDHDSSDDDRTVVAAPGGFPMGESDRAYY